MCLTSLRFSQSPQCRSFTCGDLCTRLYISIHSPGIVPRSSRDLDASPWMIWHGPFSEVRSRPLTAGHHVITVDQFAGNPGQPVLQGMQQVTGTRKLFVSKSGYALARCQRIACLEALPTRLPCNARQVYLHLTVTSKHQQVKWATKAHPKVAKYNTHTISSFRLKAQLSVHCQARRQPNTINSKTTEHQG